MAFFFILLISLLFTKCQKSGIKTAPGINEFENKSDFSVFINPPARYRSFPFYSINDSLDAREIKQQILGFKQAGFGGFYLHSRIGLLTGFLGQDWWKIMDAANEAANETGLNAMFYDEDKWPSGFAGGLVPETSENFRARCLARLAKDTPLPTGAELIKKDSCCRYVEYTAQFGYDIFNGTCYTDLFNPEAVRTFIEFSYAPYAERYQAKNRDYPIGIFTDEPHIHARYFDKKTPALGTLSYSPWVEKKFSELYGYNLRDKINLLYEEKENWRQSRIQYYRAVAQQFEESFTKQISAFCREKGIIFTGHFLGEDDLEKVRDRIGNSMCHYRNMQQPGMDLLGLSTKGRILTAKSLSSVANQYGIVRRISEMFGISGQNMNFEDRKWIAGWHSILGVNHFCPHLTLYSMKGARKRDYPPTFSYHQPYWAFNKKIEDYLGRIAYCSTIGQYDPQVLVINPLESEYIKGKNDGEFTSGINFVLELLQSCHYDYDLGDEQILADTARIINNKLEIGVMVYRHVILPDMISVREATIGLLSRLQERGGIIISTGRFPEYIDGLPGGTRLEEFQKKVIRVSPEKLKEVLLSKIPPEISVSGKDAEKVWSQARVVPGGKLVQLYNISHTEPARFSVKTNFPGGNVLLWDPSSENCYKTRSGGNGEYTIELAPSSTAWLTSGKLSRNIEATNFYRLPEKATPVLSLENKWKVRRLNPNALTLDFATYSTDNGKTFSPAEPVIGIFSRLADKKYSGRLTLRYPVQIENIPALCKLVLEQPRMYSQIRINGKDYQFENDGLYVGREFETSGITQFLMKGANIIELKLDFKSPEPLSKIQKERYGTEIESIYLIGDFAVTGSSGNETTDTQRNQAGDLPIRPVYRYAGFSIIPEKEISEGNLTVDGYPFYAGAAEFRQNFVLESFVPGRKYFLEIPDCETIVAVVEINSQVADTLCWAPFTADITRLLRKGQNELKITLCNSLRNLFGPHHHKEGELDRVGPNSFTGAGGFPGGRGEPDWYDIRKTSKETAIWTDTYNMIPFGFLKPIRIISTSEKR